MRLSLFIPHALVLNTATTPPTTAQPQNEGDGKAGPDDNEEVVMV
jgi:hypothetical protein